MLWNILKLIERFEAWLHRIKVRDIIAHHCRGYVKARVESWWQGNQIIYYEGELLELRKLKWKDKDKLYKQRVLTIHAENDTLVVQIWSEKPKLQKFIQEKLQELKNHNKKETD